MSTQKSALESELSELKRRHHQIQEEIRRLRHPGTGNHPTGLLPYESDEVDKANEIIRKLQDEVKSLKSRARTAESSLRQMQKVTKDSQSMADQLRTDSTTLREKLEEKTKELTAITLERDRLQSELEESRKLVEANEKVIEWLHNQVNEDSLNRLLGRPAASLPIPGINYRYDLKGETSTKNFGNNGNNGLFANLGGNVVDVPSSSSTSPPDILNILNQ